VSPSDMLARRTLIFVVVLAALLSVTACQAQPRVTISTKAGREVAFLVEIADTAGKREMGLQYRRELADDRGMIFLFPAESQQTFWMKNTPIPLDMIFINRERKIIGNTEKTKTCYLDPRSVSATTMNVLTIN